MDDVWSNFTIYDSAKTQEQQQHQLQLKHQKQLDEEDSVVGDLVLVKSEKPDNIGSVVVDLVTHRVGRMNSVDSVARTNSLSWSENIVINSEQSNHPTVVSIKQESLDDCLVTTTMTTAAVVQTPPPSLSNNHRYSANTMPATTTTPASTLRRTLSQSIPYNSINNSNKQNVSSSSGSNSYSCSSNLSRHHQLDRSASMPVTTIIKLEPMDGGEADDSGACGSASDPTTTYPPTVKVDDDPYAEFLSEIRRDWLHFRPKTPPTPLSLDGDNEPSDFGEPTLQFSERTQLQIELQRLAEEPSSSLMLNTYDENGSDLLLRSANDDNLFVTGPFTLDDLMDDQQNQTNAMTTHESLSSGGGNDINLSGDSLPELCLSLGENDENEKMLENILQECEFDDLKTFNTNANFWNGILEDACDDIDDPVNKKSAFDKLAATDFINATDRNHKVGKRKSQHARSTARSGCSTFSISNIPKDDFFKKEDPPPPLSVTEEGASPTVVASIASANPPVLVVTTAAIDDSSRNHQLSSTTNTTTHIKIEPPDDILETVKLTRPLQQQQILLSPANVIKTEVVQATNIPSTVYTSTTAVQQANAIILQQMQHQQQHQQQQELQKLQQQAQQVQKTFVIQQQQQQLLQQQQQSHQTVQLQHQQSGEGTLILSNTASPMRRTTNGPADKNGKSSILLKLRIDLQNL